MIIITKKKKNVETKDFRAKTLAINEIKAVEEIEASIGRKISVVDDIEAGTNNIYIEGGHVIEMRLASNRLTRLPESLFNFKKLQILDLQNNNLTELPEAIGKLKSLKVLNLYANQLTTLPESIGNLESLESLFIEENRR